MSLVKLAANTDLGPLAHEAGGQLLDALLPLMQARAGAALHDAAAMQAAVEQSAGCSPARLAAMLLHVGSHRPAAEAACTALLHAVQHRGVADDVPIVAAALAHVCTARHADDWQASLWQLAAEAVEAVHQRHGPLPCDAAMQWLVGAAQQLGLPQGLCQRMLACADATAAKEREADACVAMSQDSLLGSLADEMGV